MSVIWSGISADQHCRESWQEWEQNLLLREREWERRAKRSGPNLMLFGVGLTPYIALLIVGAAVWCLLH